MYTGMYLLANNHLIGRQVCLNSLAGRTPRKYVIDVTSIGQRSSAWPCTLSESRDIFHLECKLHFPVHDLCCDKCITNVSESIGAKY